MGTGRAWIPVHYLPDPVSAPELWAAFFTLRYEVLTWAVVWFLVFNGVEVRVALAPEDPRK